MTEPETDRLGTNHTGRELTPAIPPYDCPTCGRRILARRPHLTAGPCAACTTNGPTITISHPHTYHEGHP